MDEPKDWVCCNQESEFTVAGRRIVFALVVLLVSMSPLDPIIASLRLGLLPALAAALC